MCPSPAYIHGAAYDYAEEQTGAALSLRIGTHMDMYRHSKRRTKKTIGKVGLCVFPALERYGMLRLAENFIKGISNAGDENINIALQERGRSTLNRRNI